MNTGCKKKWRSLCVVLALFGFVACHRAAVAPAAPVAEAPPPTLTPASATAVVNAPPAQDSYAAAPASEPAAASSAAAENYAVDHTPFEQVASVFDAFAKLVDETSASPSEGVQRLRNFCAVQHESLQHAVQQLQTLHTTKHLLAYARARMAMNAHIDNTMVHIAQQVSQHFGEQGGEVMSLLADLADEIAKAP